TMLRLYDWLLSQDPTAVDIDARVAATPPLSTLQAEVARSFREPEIARNAWEETRRKHASPAAVRTRLETLRTIWPELQSQLAAAVEPAAGTDRRRRRPRRSGGDRHRSAAPRCRHPPRAPDSPALHRARPVGRSRLAGARRHRDSTGRIAHGRLSKRSSEREG